MKLVDISYLIVKLKICIIPTDSFITEQGVLGQNYEDLNPDLG